MKKKDFLARVREINLNLLLFSVLERGQDALVALLMGDVATAAVSAVVALVLGLLFSKFKRKSKKRPPH